MPNIRAPYVRAEVETAVWAAFRDGVITNILDNHGVIARIVPRDQNSSNRVLTMSGLDDLATLLRAVQAGARLRLYPIGSEGQALNATYVLRAFTNEDGSLYSHEADIRDAYVWMSGVAERFWPVNEVLKAINNASTGSDGHDNPMAVIEWKGTP